MALSDILETNEAQSVICLGERGYDEGVCGMSRLANMIDFVGAYLRRHYYNKSNWKPHKAFKILYHRRSSHNQGQRRRVSPARNSVTIPVNETKRDSGASGMATPVLKTGGSTNPSGFTRRVSMVVPANENEGIANRVFDRKSSIMPPQINPSQSIRGSKTVSRKTFSATGSWAWPRNTYRLITRPSQYLRNARQSMNRKPRVPISHWIMKEHESALPSTLMERLIAAEFVMRSFTHCSTPLEGWVSCALRGIKLNFHEHLSLIAGRIQNVLIDTSCLSHFSDARLVHQRALNSCAIDKAGRSKQHWGHHLVDFESSSEAMSSEAPRIRHMFTRDEPRWPFHIFFQLLEGHEVFLPEPVTMSLKFRKCDPATFALFTPTIEAIKRFRDADGEDPDTMMKAFSGDYDPQTTQLAILFKRATNLGQLVPDPGMVELDPEEQLTQLSTEWLRLREMQRQVQVKENIIVQDMTKRELPSLIMNEERVAASGEKERVSEKNSAASEDPSKSAFFRTLLVDHRLNAKKTMTSLVEKFGFTDEELEAVFGILAAILHFSNLQFSLFAPLDCYLVGDTSPQKTASVDSYADLDKRGAFHPTDSTLAPPAVSRFDKRVSRLTNEDIIKYATEDAELPRTLPITSKYAKGAVVMRSVPPHHHEDPSATANMLKTYPCPVASAAAAHAALTAGVLKIPIAVSDPYVV
eukprot:Blabericola_migrator_1__461@NODE_110_length_13983_cov_82_900618_g98_i0_p3_GENE_NODE_110_length_13983_cov_82_900618_g98_i0NODE_110_length_13983_cov_82_900618_g98_i0_p3_ORF_typecomplete_len696_score113_71Myosin_head/PF00063_21/3_5e02Myosin_head/PF00063_21/0_018Myosin_head/PF00063_21/0_00061_NODE_110_length_13983_cov_82_900618_g98_i038345921